MSSIYNSDRKIEQLFLGSEEITEMYLGNQLVFSKITNNLFYKLHEFVGSLTVRNTVEAVVKSAVLKGNALVNISPLNGEITIPPGFARYIDSPFIKANTTFTISFNCSSVPTTEVIEFRQINGSLTVKTEKKPVVQGYNRFKVTTVSSGVTRFRFINEIISETEFIFNNLMILEGDYTNVDIPYFEGMGAVKTPVLTTNNCPYVFGKGGRI